MTTCSGSTEPLFVLVWICVDTLARMPPKALDDLALAAMPSPVPGRRGFPVRKQGLANHPRRPCGSAAALLQRFPFIWEHSAIPHERKTP
jgi:hypothetical protein